MKAKIKQIIEAYKILGEAKVTKLEESEVIKVVKARKAMRPIAEEFEHLSEGIKIFLIASDKCYGFSFRRMFS